MPKVLDLPEVKVGRSVFPREFRKKMTFNSGDLVPLAIECNVTPGDTVKIPIKALIRAQTPLYPVMDNLVFDVAAYFVPDRLDWIHFKEFWGENNLTFWEEPTKYEIPQIEAPQGGWAIGSLADKMGLPTGIDGISVSHMPFRAYCNVWNSYYRDENLKEPIFYNTDETTLTGKNYDAQTYDYTTDIQLGAACAKVAKRADYFTKSLPEPQKSSDVFIPLGESAPVFAGTDNNQKLDESAMHWRATGGNNNIQAAGNGYIQLLGIGANDDLQSTSIQDNSSHDAGYVNVNISPSNLYVDLTQALGATVNQLRTAVALQRYAETIARSGSRYIEILRGVFGVKSSDARLQRPEYIGGKSFPLSMAEVQNSAQSSGNQLGNVGGTSKTLINDYLGTKSFEEHGTLIIVGAVRIKRHSYQNGIHRMWTRIKQSDFYNRAFDHLGESKVRNDEIFAQGTNDDSKPFGYQPAFEDMRLGQSYVTGEMRSSAQTSLDAWHYADDYSQLPTLSSEWIDEDKANIDRTLSINSSVADQFFGDFLFEMEWTRGMSMYGTPGFMDHM